MTRENDFIAACGAGQCPWPFGISKDALCEALTAAAKAGHTETVQHLLSILKTSVSTAAIIAAAQAPNNSAIILRCFIDQGTTIPLDALYAAYIANNHTAIKIATQLDTTLQWSTYKIVDRLRIAIIRGNISDVGDLLHQLSESDCDGLRQLYENQEARHHIVKNRPILEDVIARISPTERRHYIGLLESAIMVHSCDSVNHLLDRLRLTDDEYAKIINVFVAEIQRCISSPTLFGEAIENFKAIAYTLHNLYPTVPAVLPDWLNEKHAELYSILKPRC